MNYNETETYEYVNIITYVIDNGLVYFEQGVLITPDDFNRLIEYWKSEENEYGEIPEYILENLNRLLYLYQKRLEYDNILINQIKLLDSDIQNGNVEIINLRNELVDQFSQKKRNDSYRISQIGKRDSEFLERLINLGLNNLVELGLGNSFTNRVNERQQENVSTKRRR